MEIERVEVAPRQMLGLHEVVRPDGLTEFFSRAFGMTGAALQELGAHPAGPPVAAYRMSRADEFDVIAGFPVSSPVTPPPGLELTELPGGQAITAIHQGSYDLLPDAYGEINAWMKEHRLTSAEPMWEEYLTGPDSGNDPANWRTRIVFPIAERLPDAG